ncbi:MAG: hypothetical protein Q4B43_04100 [Bacteroidota bacterium]|nr:hypothetical protein [Bacteroidota bacterium]
MRIVCLLLFLFCVTYDAEAQNVIKGKVIAQDGIPLENISVLLTDVVNNKVLSYTFTNKDGDFGFKTPYAENLSLKFTSLSYKEQTLEVNFTASNGVFDHLVVMESKSTNIKEVVLEFDRPIVEKKDTISFLASSFLQGNEQVVEDLLRKIPGLDIDEKGTIRVYNREVEKVMVEGDDFFEKGYKMLTKNMPVNPIETVEVLLNYSDNKHLKNVEKSDKVALNLTLKEDSKNIWFGNIHLGYGVLSDNRYSAGANLMNFSKKYKVYLFSNLNNISHDASGELEDIVNPNRFQNDDLGINVRQHQFVELVSNQPSLKNKRVAFNNTELVAVSSIFNFSERVKLKTLGLVKWDERDFVSNNYQKYINIEQPFEIREQSYLRKKEFTGFVNLDLNYDINSNNSLQVISKINTSDERDLNQMWFDRKPIVEKLQTEKTNLGQNIRYTNKLQDKKVLMLRAYWNHYQTPQQYQNDTLLFADVLGHNANSIQQNVQYRNTLAKIEGSLYNRSKNDNYLDLNFGNTFVHSGLESKIYTHDNQHYFDDENFINNVNFQQNQTYFKASYSRSLTSKILLRGGIDVRNVNNNFENGFAKRNDNYFQITPDLFLEWKVNPKNVLQLLNKYGTVNVNATNYYQGYIYSSFRNFSRGIDRSVFTNFYSSMLKYTFGKWTDRFHLDADLSYIKRFGFLGSASTFTPNINQLTYVLLNNHQTFGASANINRFFKEVSSNIKIKGGFSNTFFPRIVNLSNKSVRTYQHQYAVELRSAFDGIFNYHFGTNFIHNEVNTDGNQNFYNTNFTFLDLLFNINSKWHIELQTERYYFSNLPKNQGVYYFTDILMRYHWIPNQIAIAFSLNNLFNNTRFASYSVDEVAMYSSEYRLVSRYALLTMSYRF